MGISGDRDEEGSIPPSWPAERGSDPGAAMPSNWPARMTEAVLQDAKAPLRVVDDDAEEPLWERWFERAVEEGVDEELAMLGRAVIRSARSARVEADHRAECGWSDEGDAMLELALEDADGADEHWRRLLDVAVAG